MKAVLLGSGTAVPHPARGSAGIALRGAGFTVLVDAGSGTGQRLVRAGIHPVAVEAIVLTHFHPDHIGDLIPFLFALRNPRFEAERRWPCLVGPRGLREFYRRLRAPFAPWIPEEDREIELVELTEEEVPAARLGTSGFRLSARHVEHTEHSLAYRLTDDQGNVVVCSGDTAECAAIVDLAAGADLLFLECSFPRGHPVEGHLDPAGVSRIVRDSGARRVVLTHFYPECDEVDLMEQFDPDIRRQICLGEDLSEFNIGA